MCKVGPPGSTFQSEFHRHQRRFGLLPFFCRCEVFGVLLFLGHVGHPRGTEVEEDRLLDGGGNGPKQTCNPFIRHTTTACNKVYKMQGNERGGGSARREPRSYSSSETVRVRERRNAVDRKASVAIGAFLGDEPRGRGLASGCQKG